MYGVVWCIIDQYFEWCVFCGVIDGDDDDVVILVVVLECQMFVGDGGGGLEIQVVLCCVIVVGDWLCDVCGQCGVCGVQVGMVVDQCVVDFVFDVVGE